MHVYDSVMNNVDKALMFQLVCNAGFLLFRKSLAMIHAHLQKHSFISLST